MTASLTESPTLHKYTFVVQSYATKSLYDKKQPQTQELTHNTCTRPYSI